jgi:hypothetical protein
MGFSFCVFYWMGWPNGALSPEERLHHSYQLWQSEINVHEFSLEG